MPPLILAFSSGRYHIKWTQLADLLVSPIMLSLYIAVQDQTIYVAGHASAVAEAHEQLQAYVYDVSIPISGGSCLSQVNTMVHHVAIIKGKLLLVDIFSNAINRTNMQRIKINKATS